MAMSEARAGLKGKVEIYKGWCKKCGICAAFCPKDVLEMGPDGYPRVKDPEACTACGWCEIRCPDFAIVVSKDEQEQGR
jgi:2-oxoglutarate ferredoxin oxidoreductase subunit delta